MFRFTKFVLLALLPALGLQCMKPGEDRSLELALMDAVFYEVLASRLEPISSDNADGTVSLEFDGSTLLWTKCLLDSSGSATIYQGLGKEDPCEGTPGTFQFCPTSGNNDCNGGTNGGLANSTGSVTNSPAADACESLTLAGLSNWRLPTKSEATSMMFEVQVVTPEIFPNWSGNTHSGESRSLNSNWVYGVGGAIFLGPKDTARPVRCVSDG